LIAKLSEQVLHAAGKMWWSS